MNSIDLIKDLSCAFGAPGFEDDVVKVASRYLPSGYRCETDSLLNLYMYKEKWDQSLPTLLIDAHSDEVGMMVRAIKPNGTIAFTTLGMWSPAVLSAQKVLIKNTDGDFITGIIASKPPHFVQKDEEVGIDSLIIDIGATSKQEVEEHFKISIACPIVPDTQFDYFVDEDIMMSKAFDCRLGCAAVLEVLDNLKELSLKINIVGVLSAQEEIGIRGAKVVANKVRPDICIAFEGTPADDTFAHKHFIQTRLKKGPMLRHIDQGMITNPRFMRFAIETAAKHGIPMQQAVRTGGSTNGAAYHLSNLGVPTIIVGHPVRYAHSHNSIATLGDYKNGVALATEIAKVLDLQSIQTF